MQTETIIIMIVGLISLSLIRLIVGMVGREFRVDHSAAQVSDRFQPSAAAALASVDMEPRPRVTRGTGRNRHLLYFPPIEGEAQAS
ncbi:MAG: hypothetical protein WAW88_16150 [Nocardioides sp.]